MLPEVRPRGHIPEAAVVEPVRVGRDPVVPPPLDVQRRQVQRHRVRHLEQPLGELAVHDLLRRGQLAGRGEEAAQERVHPALLHQPPRRKEGAMQRHIALGYRAEVGVQPAQQGLDEGVAEAEGGGGENVGNGGVQAGVVAAVGRQRVIGTSNQGQPLPVRDVLHFCSNNLTRLLWG